MNTLKLAELTGKAQAKPVAKVTKKQKEAIRTELRTIATPAPAKAVSLEDKFNTLLEAFGQVTQQLSALQSAPRKSKPKAETGKTFSNGYKELAILSEDTEQSKTTNYKLRQAYFRLVTEGKVANETGVHTPDTAKHAEQIGKPIFPSSSKFPSLFMDKTENQARALLNKLNAM
jgi:hypothetical protein